MPIPTSANKAFLRLSANQALQCAPAGAVSSPYAVSVVGVLGNTDSRKSLTISLAPCANTSEGLLSVLNNRRYMSFMRLYILLAVAIVGSAKYKLFACSTCIKRCANNKAASVLPAPVTSSRINKCGLCSIGQSWVNACKGVACVTVWVVEAFVLPSKSLSIKWGCA